WQPRARPTPGPASTWATKFRLPAKNKDLRPSPASPPADEGDDFHLVPALQHRVVFVPAQQAAVQLDRDLLRGEVVLLNELRHGRAVRHVAGLAVYFDRHN